jgi:hypothetical protein
MNVNNGESIYNICDVIYILYIEICDFNFAPLNVLQIKPVPHCPSTPLPNLPQCPKVPLPHYASTLLPPLPPPCYSSICTMATVNRTLTGIRDEKLVLWVLVDQLKATERTKVLGIKRG